MSRARAISSLSRASRQEQNSGAGTFGSHHGRQRRHCISTTFKKRDCSDDFALKAAAAVIRNVALSASDADVFPSTLACVLAGFLLESQADPGFSTVVRMAVCLRSTSLKGLEREKVLAWSLLVCNFLVVFYPSGHVQHVFLRDRDR